MDLDALKWDEKGLISIIFQDHETGEVLVLGYMNREALELTIKTGKTHFYSRSRAKLWCKGETSGNVQHVDELRMDCDGDTLLVRVRQEGGACHKGYRSCFFRALDDESTWRITASPVFDPKQAYGKK